MNHKINQAIFALPENSPREEIEKAIKNSWPKELGIKENFPYKVWLDERNEFLIAYGFKKGKSKSEKVKATIEVEGQLKLF
jgi:hypothetical protein